MDNVIDILSRLPTCTFIQDDGSKTPIECDVVELVAQLPHYLVHTKDKDIHIIPKVLIDEIVDGNLLINELPPEMNSVIASIIREWQEKLNE